MFEEVENGDCRRGAGKMEMDRESPGQSQRPGPETGEALLLQKTLHSQSCTRQPAGPGLSVIRRSL